MSREPGLLTYLREPPMVDDLDDNGCFSKDACIKLDHMMLEYAAEEIRATYFPGTHGKGTDPNNKWRTVSCLQKAVRFGDAEMAKFAVSAAFDMDKAYIQRRLGVIAVEDVRLRQSAGRLRDPGGARLQRLAQERRRAPAGDLAGGAAGGGRQGPLGVRALRGGGAERDDRQGGPRQAPGRRAANNCGGSAAGPRAAADGDLAPGGHEALLGVRTCRRTTTGARARSSG